MSRCKPKSSAVDLRVVSLLPYFALALAAIAHANIWDVKPFLQWTWIDAARILDSSPWVSPLDVSFGASKGPWLQVAGFLDPRTVPGVQKYRNEGPFAYPNRYSARLLTAKPVRDAYLRFISLRPGQTGGVSLAELQRECSPESERLRLDKFLASNPDDIRIKGSDTYIILSITEFERSYMYDRNINIIGVTEFFKSEGHPGAFRNLEFSTLKPVTFLSTKTGKRVGLARYEEPGPDDLGAKFYFPRALPDGRPFMTPEDKEVRFESRIDDIYLAARFEAKKLLWQGRLEY